MIRAAGCIFIAKSTKRILLNFRSEQSNKPNCFGFWGGKVDPSENIFEGLSRECTEELGFIPVYERITIIDQFVSPDGHFIRSPLLFPKNSFQKSIMNHKGIAGVV